MLICLFTILIHFQLNEDEISLHIDEVLADLTGVNSALKAYKDFIQNREEELLLPWIGLSPIQTYFLTIAQVNKSIYIYTS